MKKPPKILIVLPWNSYGAAGIERFLGKIANNLAGQYEVCAATIAPEYFEQDVFSDEIHFKVLKSDRARKAVWQLRGLIKEFKPDILIANVPHLGTISFVAKLLAGSRSKLISVYYGFDQNKMVDSLHIYLSFFFSKKVIVVAEDLKKILKENFKFNVRKVSVIYNGVDISRVQRLAEENLGNKEIIWNAKTPTIIAVGRMARQKSFDVLLNALSEIIHYHKREVSLILIGDGELRSDLQELAFKLKISDNVYFLGWKENPFKYMKHADVFTLSSYFEGLPSVLIEAMACGVPIVSTDCPTGPAEILDGGKYGSLVPVGDVDSLAIAIIKTLDQKPDTSALRSRADMFSFDLSLKQYYKIIGDLVV